MDRKPMLVGMWMGFAFIASVLAYVASPNIGLGLFFAMALGGVFTILVLVIDS